MKNAFWVMAPVKNLFSICEIANIKVSHSLKINSQNTAMYTWI